MKPTTNTPTPVTAIRVPGFRELYEEYQQLPYEALVALLFDFHKPRQVLELEPIP